MSERFNEIAKQEYRLRPKSLIWSSVSPEAYLLIILGSIFVGISVIGIAAFLQAEFRHWESRKKPAKKSEKGHETNH